MEVHLEIGDEEENSIQEVGRLEMKVAMTPILRLAASGSEASLASVLGAFQPSSYLYPGMSGTRSSRTEAGPHQRLSTECVGKRKICFLLGCFVCSVYGGYTWRCRKLGLRKTLVDFHPEMTRKSQRGSLYCTNIYDTDVYEESQSCLSLSYRLTYLCALSAIRQIPTRPPIGGHGAMRGKAGTCSFSNVLNVYGSKADVFKKDSKNQFYEKSFMLGAKKGKKFI